MKTSADLRNKDKITGDNIWWWNQDSGELNNEETKL